MNILISEEEIRETFYNLMLESAINNDLYEKLQSKPQESIKLMIKNAIIEICQMRTQQGFPTIRNNWITKDNTPVSFIEMFQYLELLTKMERDSYTYCIRLESIIDLIQRKNTFKGIIKSVVKFYTDSFKPNTCQVTDRSIRETFYNLMVTEILTNDIIKSEALRDRDPFIYIGMSSQAILSSILHCSEIEDIILQNGCAVTQYNCPENYKLLFRQLLSLKNFVKTLKLHNQEDKLKLIRLYSVTDPDIEIPDNLEKLKTPEIMKVVSIITSLAIQISSTDYFRSIIEDVIKFSIEARG